MHKIIAAICILAFFLVSGCSSHGSKETRQVQDLPELSCVAVLPVSIPVTAGGSISSDMVQDLRKGADFLDELFREIMGAETGFKVLSQNQLNAIISDQWGGRLQQIRDVGAATGCGAVLETAIGQYRQRVGGPMSVDSPAAAAFSMELIGVKQGVVLWATSFEEQQKALFDDIFSFGKAEKRGFKWLTAQEIIRDGVNSRMKEFPYFQGDRQ